jgi:DNA-binding transcriptional MerR regulator
LRFYEQEGLLPAARSATGYRLYGEDAVERLEFIADAKRLGLPLGDIRELLAAWDEGECAILRDRLRPLLEARIAEARRQADEAAALMGRLTAALSNLAAPPVAGRCDPGCCLDAPGAAVAMPAVDCCLLPADAQARQLAEWRDLLAQARRREPIDGGARVRLPVSAATRAAALAAAEVQCCPFFGFTLHFAEGEALLDVRAPADRLSALSALVGNVLASLAAAAQITALVAVGASAEDVGDLGGGGGAGDPLLKLLKVGAADDALALGSGDLEATGIQHPQNRVGFAGCPALFDPSCEALLDEAVDEGILDHGLHELLQFFAYGLRHDCSNNSRIACPAAGWRDRERLQNPHPRLVGAHVDRVGDNMEDCQFRREPSGYRGQAAMPGGIGPQVEPAVPRVNRRTATPDSLLGQAENQEADVALVLVAGHAGIGGPREGPAVIRCLRLNLHDGHDLPACLVLEEEHVVGRVLLLALGIADCQVTVRDDGGEAGRQAHADGPQQHGHEFRLVLQNLHDGLMRDARHNTRAPPSRLIRKSMNCCDMR